MTKTIIDAVSRSCLIRPGSSILCAVSGGADSMCLLHFLFSNRETFGISVFAAHYNHSLRGEESERDCAFVSDYCQQHGIPLRVGKGDVAAFAPSGMRFWRRQLQLSDVRLLQQPTIWKTMPKLCFSISCAAVQLPALPGFLRHAII